MKTKKMILRITTAIFVFAVVFIACKKNKDEANTGKQGPVASTNNVLSARSTGVQTYYSKSASGSCYKMELSWAGDGSVSVDRTTLATCPTGVETIWQFADDTPFTIFDHDTTTTGIDSITVAIAGGKEYYFVPFTPGESEYPICCKSGVALHCECISGGGFCSLIFVTTSTGNRTFTCDKVNCSTCKLEGVNRFTNETIISETNLTAGNAGGVFFEASAINVTH